MLEVTQTHIHIHTHTHTFTPYVLKQLSKLQVRLIDPKTNLVLGWYG